MFDAFGQSVHDPVSISRTPVFEQIMEPQYTNRCREVIVDNGPRIAPIIIGGVVGYNFGRIIDRNYYHGYYRGRGPYVRDYPVSGARMGGAIVGGVIGSQYRRDQYITQVCDDNYAPVMSNVLVGYKIREHYIDGSIREYFEAQP